MGNYLGSAVCVQNAYVPCRFFVSKLMIIYSHSSEFYESLKDSPYFIENIFKEVEHSVKQLSKIGNICLRVAEAI